MPSFLSLPPRCLLPPSPFCQLSFSSLESSAFFYSFVCIFSLKCFHTLYFDYILFPFPVPPSSSLPPLPNFMFLSPFPLSKKIQTTKHKNLNNYLFYFYLTLIFNLGLLTGIPGKSFSVAWEPYPWPHYWRSCLSSQLPLTAHTSSCYMSGCWKCPILWDEQSAQV